MSQRVTRGYRELQGGTAGCKRLRGLQGVSEGYMRFRGLQAVTRGYSGLQKVRMGYRA